MTIYKYYKSYPKHPFCYKFQCYLIFQYLIPITYCFHYFQVQKRSIKMGLDYLNKKVWHPGSMKNIQKVWQVEQEQREINKRIRERAKKLLEEQHNQQLKRIQVEAGLIPRSHLERMEWLYDWGNKIGQQKANQQYLTGQKAADDAQKNFRHVIQEEITNRKCEDFQLLHEDPMYQIMRQEKLRRDAITNNPIEMRNIIKEVQKEYLPQDFQERKQKYYSSRRRRSSSSSSSEVKKKKKSKKTKESRSRSRSRERRQQKGKDKKSFKQSGIYQKYLQERFGGILKKEQDGKLVPDYSKHKSKYRTQHQMDKDQLRKRNDKLRENVRRLQEIKDKRSRSRSSQSSQNFEEGAAKIRKNMLAGVKQNRNHKSYRHQDSD